jgi:uncharacterized protein YecE (DUF72 family)
LDIAAPAQRRLAAGLTKLPAVRIGTSGWVYKTWRGPFYPEKLPQRLWLHHYAEAFDTAEVNGSFYRLPSQATVAAWRDATPPDFTFAWKASRFITHMKRLRAATPSLERILAPMQALGLKLGPMLFQLPPSMILDLPRLTDFLALLPAAPPSVIEFRHPSWYVDTVFEALARRGVALCVSDHHHAPAPWLATAPFAYVRGHGPSGRYVGSYSDEALIVWARRIERWRIEGKPVYAYFDNDVAAAAPSDARRLRVLVERAHSAKVKMSTPDSQP